MQTEREVEFVNSASHELKTPLTSIKGFSETLRYVEDNETKNKFLDIIDKESERLTNLINDILVLSNIENLHKMDHECFKPGEVVENVLEIVKSQALKKNISIEYKDEFNNKIIGSKDKFHQLALNLIENSIKYSNDGAIVKINLTLEGEYFIFKVSDNGIGIPKNDIPRIFERFYRVDKTRSRDIGGSGLGLSIVKHILEAHSSQIKVESEESKGTKFEFSLKR